MTIVPFLPLPMPFVRYDPTGRITGWGYMEPAHIAAEGADGVGIVSGYGRPETHYVDLSGPGPVLRKRRNLVVAFSTRTPAPGAATRVTLPLDTAVSVKGPVAGTSMASGAVDIVLRVPGTYEILFEAWPRAVCVETLTVPVADGPVPDAPSDALVFGPSLDDVKTRAKEIVTQRYADLALMFRPLGLQASDFLKLQDAALVLNGGKSDWIIAEAADRGIDASTLAKAIVAESNKTIVREAERTSITQSIRRATTESEVIKTILPLGLQFSF